MSEGSLLPIRESKELRFREQAPLLQSNNVTAEIIEVVYKAMARCLFYPHETKNPLKGTGSLKLIVIEANLFCGRLQ